MHSRILLFTIITLCALSLSGCKEGTQFTVNGSFATVVQHMQEQLASTPASKKLAVQHTYTNRIGFSYLDDTDPTSLRRVTILIEGQNAYETQVTIRCDRVSGGRLPECEHQIQQSLFPTLAPAH